MLKVANLLLKDGHEKIAYLAGWEGASTQRDREAGFVDALRKAGKSIVSRSVGNFRTEQTREAALSLFNVPVSKRPDAIFVANDHMALTTMDVIRFSLNLSIPNDVAIVGFDDVVFAHHVFHAFLDRYFIDFVCQLGSNLPSQIQPKSMKIRC